MNTDVHGTRRDPAKRHPVFDLPFWEAKFPLRDARDIGGVSHDKIEGLAHAEQARRLAREHGDLGPCVPADVFVWSYTCTNDADRLTRIGGVPWRESDRPWPTDDNGHPLHFLGQVSFVDSMDLVPFPLPGDVALIFGTFHCGSASTVEGCALEWSPRMLRHSARLYEHVPPHLCLPRTYHGVIHRTVQYTDWSAYEAPFTAAGVPDGGFGVGAMQATSIGQYAHLPQGWPFDKGDGSQLVAVLNSFYFWGRWPLCDVPDVMRTVRPDGTLGYPVSDPGEFGIGDVGAIWIWRDKAGAFHVDEACG